MKTPFVECRERSSSHWIVRDLACPLGCGRLGGALQKIWEISHHPWHKLGLDLEAAGTKIPPHGDARDVRSSAWRRRRSWVFNRLSDSARRGGRPVRCSVDPRTAESRPAHNPFVRRLIHIAGYRHRSISHAMLDHA